jgi:hypothetical protein
VINELVIQPVAPSSVEVQPIDQPVVQLGLTNIGLRGPQGVQGEQGIPGPNEIGGFPVALSNAQEKDLLQLKSWSWQNTPQEALTDGGNF